MQIFIFLAAAGLILSIIVHVSALLGIPNLLKESAWILHGGVFVVWIPAVIVCMKWQYKIPPKDFWKYALIGCPAWMKKMAYLFFGYAILNFIIFLIVTLSKTPTPSAGDTPDNVFRGFSGHWMAFYSAALAIIYSHVYGRDKIKIKKCPNGHETFSITAEYCEKCGNKFI